jgi:hypothetical protein
VTRDGEEQEPPGGTSQSAVDDRDGLGWRPLLFLAAVVLFVHTLSPSVQVADSRMTVPVASAVLEDGTLSLDGVDSVPDALDYTRYDVVERDGATLPFFPWPPMLLALPGVAIAEVAGVDTGELRPSSPNETWPIEIPTAAVIVALTAVVLALVAYEAAPGSRHARAFSVGCGLVFAFATGAWSTASRALWQHTPAMLCWSLALLAALRAKRQVGFLWLLGAALGVGFTMRPTAAVPMVTLGIWALVVHRRDVWRVIAGAGAALAPFAIVNLATYGELLPPYYAGDRIVTEESIPFFESLAVQLVSPSRGLLVYTPLVLLAPVGLWLKRRQGALDGLDVAVAATVVLHWFVVGTYGSTGGASYGARFFTEALPFLLYLVMPVGVAIVDGTATRGLRWATVTLVVLSLALTLPGALTRASYCWNTSPTFVDTEPERVWDWSDPQFARPFGRLQAGDSIRSVVVAECDAA